jgi:hypothetical protein
MLNSNVNDGSRKKHALGLLLNARIKRVDGLNVRNKSEIVNGDWMPFERTNGCGLNGSNWNKQLPNAQRPSNSVIWKFVGNANKTTYDD